MNVVYLIGFIQALFVSSSLLFKKRKQLSDFILVAYIMVLGAFLFFNYTYSEGIIEQNPILFFTDILYWTLIGPLLSIYIGLVSGLYKKIRPIDALHLLPTIFVLIGFMPFFFQSEVTNFFSYQSDSISYNIAIYVWYYNSPIYYLYCVYLMYRHKKRFQNYYSYRENVDLNWLFYLVHGYAIFLLFGLFAGLLRQLFGWTLPFSSYDYNWVVMSLYIFGMGYFGFQQRGLLMDTCLDSNDQKLKPNVKQVSASNVNDHEADQLRKKLIEVMEQFKAYHDCELDLRKLSSKLETTPHKLSQVINEKMNCNFYEFINQYRINEMKQALIDPQKQHLKIVSLAYDCGFNSKSSFYNLFKKSTNLSPSEYKTQYLN